MTKYIIGLTIGGLAMLVLLIWALISLFNQRKVSKKIKEIGLKEEVKINNDIRVWASHNKNKFIPASIYSYDENKVFEVDSILITDKAMIVVEIKSLTGGVKGSVNDPRWTKVLGEKRFETTNPISQNQKHIEHIQKMTGLKVPTISLIVYSAKTSFVTCDDAPKHVVLIRHPELFKTLDEINNSLNVSLTVDEMKVLEKKIKLFRTNKKKDLELHKRITTMKEKG